MASGVDPMLFVNAFSRGLNDGAKVGSEFSNFTNSLIAGFDAERKAEQERQQIELTQNKIDMLPAENAIRQAEADRARIESEFIGQNEDAILAQRQQKMENDTAKLEAEARIQASKQEFLNIMQGDDPVVKGQAIMSGQYAELFAAEQDLRKQSIESTWKGWGPQELQLLNDENKNKRTQDAFAKSRENMLAQAKEADFEFNNNTRIQSIITSGKYNPVKFLEEAELVDVGVDRIKTMPDPKNPGKLIPVPQTSDGIGGDAPAQDRRKAISYGGQLHSVSDEEAKIFQRKKTTHNYEYNLLRDQGGDGDKEFTYKQKIKAIEESQAAAKEMSVADQAKRADAMANFMGSLEYRKPYQAAADKVMNTIAANTRESLDNRAAQLYEQAGKITPLAATSTPAPAQEPAPVQSTANSPREAIVQTKARMKAEAALNKRMATPQQQAPTMPPAQQAVQATKPSTIPTEFVVNSPFSANDEVASKVNSIPELSNMPAFFKAIVATESAGNYNATSPTGAFGLGQVTQAAMDDMVEGQSRFNNNAQAALGAVYAQKLADQFDDPKVALAAYNGGAGTMAIAVRMAGSSQWKDIEPYIGAALRKAAENDSGLASVIKTADGLNKKIEEVKSYPDKVIPYFAKLAQTRSDMEMAEKLKRYGYIKY